MSHKTIIDNDDSALVPSLSSFNITTVGDTYEAKKKEAIARRNADDKRRLMKALSVENVQKHMFDAIGRGKNSFVIELDDRLRFSFEKSSKVISPESLRELKESLKSGTVLTGVNYCVLSNTYGGSDTARRLLHATIALSSGGIFGIMTLSEFNLNAILPAILTAALVCKPMEIMGRNSSLELSNVLKFTFNNPNSVRGKISSVATRTLTVGIASVKNIFRPQSSEADNFKGTYSTDFNVAAQRLVESADRLIQHANNNDLEFKIRRNDLIEQATRQIEIVEKRDINRPTLRERKTIFPMRDLADALDQCSKHTTLKQEQLSILAKQFDTVVSTLEDNIMNEELTQAVMAIEHVTVGLNRI